MAARLKQLRRDENNPEELGRLVKVAHYFAEGKAQKEIADLLDLSPATVSRMLERAQFEGIIKIRVFPPRLLTLKRKLHDYLGPLGVERVEVVPDSAEKNDKNTENLGEAGADVLMDLIKTVQDAKSPNEPIRLVLACGSTVLTVINKFIELLYYENFVNPLSVLWHDLHVYPSALFGAGEFGSYPHTFVFPHTTVVYFATAMGIRLPGIKVRAFAPVLPPGYYEHNATKRKAILQECHLTSFITEVRDADIFVLGSGTINDENYKEIEKQFYEDIEIMDPINTPEMSLIPILEDGREYKPIADKIFGAGITISEIKEISRQPNKFVMVVAGGGKKRVALQSVIRHPPFNVLVTDSTIAEETLRRQSALG